MLLYPPINRKSNIIKKIDDISMNRSTGFPQIKKIQDNLIISYTESGPKEKRTKIFIMPIRLI